MMFRCSSCCDDPKRYKAGGTEERYRVGETEVKDEGNSETTIVIPVHTKAREKHYNADDGGVDRFVVPDEKVSWDVSFPSYKPPNYTVNNIIQNKPVWADPDISDKEGFGAIKFNQLDGKVNRVSFITTYLIVDGVPRNPIGRTGVCGRGLLGKWGPNHAADPIVTRWKRDPKGKIVMHEDGRKILEFVAIQRRDTREWAIPGGMVDADEEVSLTLKREFNEEALNSLEGDQKEKIIRDIKKLFKNGEIIYKGYVDDPRNTDNAWMETVACNFHDDNGKTVGRIPLSAGDDAQAVRWLSIDRPLKLYASHTEFIEKVCAKRNAYFSNTDSATIKSSYRVSTLC